MLWFGWTKVGFPGMVPLSTAKIALIRPDSPAAGSECPILLLIYDQTSVCVGSEILSFLIFAKECATFQEGGGGTDRADDKGFFRVAGGPEDGADPFDLCWISGGCAGSVAFELLNRIGQSTIFGSHCVLLL